MTIKVRGSKAEVKTRLARSITTAIRTATLRTEPRQGKKRGADIQLYVRKQEKLDF